VEGWATKLTWFLVPGGLILSMKALFCCALGILFVATGCGKSSSETSKVATNATETSSSSPLTAPVDYLGAVAKGQQTAIKTVDTAQITHAIQMYSVEHGKNPASLQELVDEKYLGQIPAAPYGMKLVYDPASGSVKVVAK